MTITQEITATKGSRIGKMPVQVPTGVTVTAKGNHITVQGPKGKLEHDFHSAVKIEIRDGHVHFAPADASRMAKAMQGTARAIVNNMVKGAQQHFVKELEISGTGFKAVLKGKNLELSLGKSHLDIYPVPAGITVTVTDNTKLKVEGADRALVGQVTADIYHFYKVEPYKAKGVRVVGQFVRRKEGKKTA